MFCFWRWGAALVWPLRPRRAWAARLPSEIYATDVWRVWASVCLDSAPSLGSSPRSLPWGPIRLGFFYYSSSNARAETRNFALGPHTLSAFNKTSSPFLWLAEGVRAPGRAHLSVVFFSAFSCSLREGLFGGIPFSTYLAPLQKPSTKIRGGGKNFFLFSFLFPQHALGILRSAFNMSRCSKITWPRVRSSVLPQKTRELYFRLVGQLSQATAYTIKYLGPPPYHYN